MLRAVSLVFAAAAGGAAAVLTGAPATADSQVTVRGAAFPEGSVAQLSMVGCPTLYDRTTETLQPFVGRGPGQAPLGVRSRGFDLQGGNAVGPIYYVDSMADTTTAELSVYAEHGAAGVAYAGYQEPSDTGTPDVWIGRATIAAPAGSWARMGATGLSYTWTKYDMLTHQVIATGGPAPVATVSQVVDHAGDGQGFYMLGFGCDGAEFSMDAWRIGTTGNVTSYDLEGLTTTTTITGSAQQVRAGDALTLGGAVRLGRGTRLLHGTLMLESKPLGGDEFRIVAVYDAGDSDPEVLVRPEESTIYRWRFVDRPLAEGSVSPWFFVRVLAAADPPGLPESPGPTNGPDPEPSQPPSEPPTDSPSESPGPPPSEPPPTQDPPSAPPSSEPSETQEPSPPSEPDPSANEGAVDPGPEPTPH